MSKHTAGPWKFKRVNNATLAKNSSVNLLTDEDGFNLGLLSTWRDSPESEAEAEANARLISMSPELLSDLCEAATTLRRYETLHREKNTEESTAKADVNAALADRFESTIAKARGEA